MNDFHLCPKSNPIKKGKKIIKKYAKNILSDYDRGASDYGKAPGLSDYQTQRLSKKCRKPSDYGTSSDYQAEKSQKCQRLSATPATMKNI